MLLQPFPQTPKSTPVACPLMHCWNWWCFAGDAAAISAAVVLQAVETGLTLTGGLQGAIHNLQEWSNLKTATNHLVHRHANNLFITTSGWWFHHLIYATVNSDRFPMASLIKHSYKFCFSMRGLSSEVTRSFRSRSSRKKLPFCPEDKFYSYVTRCHIKREVSYFCFSSLPEVTTSWKFKREKPSFNL